MSSGRLHGKVALVVGGGQRRGATVGNGRAIAMRFAREGARVVVADRDESSADETAKLIAEEDGTATTVCADITDAQQCADMVAAAGGVGPLDIVVNNVGLSSSDTTDEEWQRVMETNVRGIWRVCDLVMPAMAERGDGAIVNVSSTAAVVSVPTHSLVYKLSKQGVNTLTQHLALEYAEAGVRVNTVMLGMIDTPLGVDFFAEQDGVSREEAARRRDAMVPLRRRMGTAWDVAAAALFLASDEAAFVTGAVLPVDGGRVSRH